MRGLAKTASGAGNVELLDVDRPTPGPGQVLVEVGYAGLCGSDVKIYTYEGAYEFIEFPLVIGHEYSGRVVEVGEGVTDVAVGDRVVEEPIRACGECYQCQTGSPNVCQDAVIIGATTDGAFADYIVASEASLHRIPDDLPLRVAAALEPTSVGVRAVTRNSRVRAGDRVLVEGPGPIGLLTAQVARHQGGDVLVTGVDRDGEHRLPIAEELGFEAANVSDRSVESLRGERTDGEGFDVVFDATGHESGLRSAATAVRKGGQVVLVGQSGDISMDFTPFIRGEVDVQCSYASTWKDFEYGLRLLSEGAVEVEPLLDDRFAPSDEGDMFRAAKAGETCKPLLEFAGEE